MSGKEVTRIGGSTIFGALIIFLFLFAVAFGFFLIGASISSILVGVSIGSAIGYVVGEAIRREIVRWQQGSESGVEQ